MVPLLGTFARPTACTKVLNLFVVVQFLRDSENEHDRCGFTERKPKYRSSGNCKGGSTFGLLQSLPLLQSIYSLLCLFDCLCACFRVCLFALFVRLVGWFCFARGLPRRQLAHIVRSQIGSLRFAGGFLRVLLWSYLVFGCHQVM